jgi:hypothetical protein
MNGVTAAMSDVIHGERVRNQQQQRLPEQRPLDQRPRRSRLAADARETLRDRNVSRVYPSVEELGVRPTSQADITFPEWPPPPQAS